MTMYVVKKYENTVIERADVVRVTKDFVIVQGYKREIREAISSEWGRFYGTREEATEVLRARLTEEINRCRENMIDAEAALRRL